MKIAILCGGGEPPFSSTQGLIRGFKQLGHDVWTLGRSYYDRNLCDVELEDRPHVEWYSYGEVLAQTPWNPDFILNIDPGGYFFGKKPQGIYSALFSTDAHRNGSLLQRVFGVGSFDIFFNAQPAYTQFFDKIIKTINTLPAVDESRFDLNVNLEPECDIAFVGQSGLAIDIENPAADFCDGKDEAGRYIVNLNLRLPADIRKYQFDNLPSYDYAERAELLYRLSQDFSVRIYEPIWDRKLQIALQKGRIGFNRSILNDISIRNFEVAMAARGLVTDYITSAPSPFGFNYPSSCNLYLSGFYKPFYQNFDLEYEQVKRRVDKALSYKLREWGEESRQNVLLNHTWKHRAERIVETIEQSR